MSPAVMFGIEGRCRRWSFALVALGCYAVPYLCDLPFTTALASLGVDVGVHRHWTQLWPTWVAAPIAIVCAVAALLAFAVLVAVAIRRLHDMHLSGVYALALLALMLLLRGVPHPQASPSFGFLLAYAILALAPGTPGANRFGSEPQSETAAPLPLRDHAS